MQALSTFNMLNAFHRPLSTYLNLLVDEGCIYRRMIEPRLDEQLVEQYGRKHARNIYVPQFVVIRADKL